MDIHIHGKPGATTITTTTTMLPSCVDWKVGRNGVIGHNVVWAAEKAHKFVQDRVRLRLQRMMIILSAADQATTSETAANWLQTALVRQVVSFQY